MSGEATPVGGFLGTPNEAKASAGAGILRDIAVGGLAGLFAGVIIGGVGGRIAMRLAAVIVPGATGLATENGQRVGDVTLAGTLALLFFGGVLAGVVAGAIWVVARPWLPSGRRERLLASIVLALAFGTILLIEADNPDFLLLRHHPVVVGMLVLLIAITGPAVVLADAWLDRRLPVPRSLRRPSAAAYAVVAAIGTLFTVGLTIPAMAQTNALVTFALACVGLTTVLVWVERLSGTDRPTPDLARLGRVVLIAAVAIGLGTALVEIAGAFGLS
jgi:hypothetical protein